MDASNKIRGPTDTQGKPAVDDNNHNSEPTKETAPSKRVSNTHSSQKGSQQKKKPKPRESFTADSPYFDSYVNRELCHLTILTETLYDISARARAAGQCGESMADATRNLSMACKLYPTFDRNGEDWVRAADDDEEGKTRERKICDARKEAVGKQIGSLLQDLGEVLDEIADAQILMCESLEASLSLALEAFANVELNEATRVKMEAEKQTQAAEAIHAKYLQRCPVLLDRAANGVSTSVSAISVDDCSATVQAAVSSNWRNISDQVGVSSFFRSGSNRASSSDNTDGRSRQYRRGTGSNSRNGAGGSSFSSGGEGGHNEKSHAVQTAVAAASMRKMLEEIRLAQAIAELKRFQLLRRLDSLKVRSVLYFLS